MDKYLKPKTGNHEPATPWPTQAVGPLGEASGQPGRRNFSSCPSPLAPCSSLQNARGFTLIEVMMASVIFLLGILAILGMQVTAMNSSKFGNQMQVATSLATGAIEDLMLRIPDDAALITTETTGPHLDPLNPVNEEGQAGGRYTRTWTVQDMLDADKTLVAKAITMSVNWTDGWGKSREVTMDYLYYVMK